jgi:hypothetical protein
MATKKLKRKSEAVWQVVQERIGFSGKIVERRKLGVPRSLESAKQIIEYKNTVELRNYIRYRIERIEDSEDNAL